MFDHPVRHLLIRSRGWNASSTRRVVSVVVLSLVLGAMLIALFRGCSMAP